MTDMNILLVSSLESFLQLIGVLLIFVVVLFVTYFATRWMAGYQKAHTYNKNLRIIDTIRIGTNKLVCIIQAGRKYLVVGIGKEEIRLLGELAEDELRDLSFLDESQPEILPESFQEMLKKFKDKIPKK